MSRPGSIIFAGLFAAASFAGAQSHAQAQAEPEATGRYELKPTGDGFLRLDTATGQVSLCADRQGAWTCRVVPDDRRAYEAEIAALAEENDRLRTTLAGEASEPGGQRSGGQRGATLPGGSTAETGPATAEADGLPSDEEMDKVFDTFEGFADRMVGLVGKLQKQFEQLEEPQQKADPDGVGI